MGQGADIWEVIVSDLIYSPRTDVECRNQRKTYRLISSV